MKKIISLLVIMAMMLASVLAMIPASAETPDGTAISSAAEFAAMQPTGKYYLTADITISTAYSDAFAGTFNGNGKKINLAGANCVFKELAGGTIENVTTDGAIITGGNLSSSGLVLEGYGTIKNVTSSVDITYTNEDKEQKININGKGAAGIIAQLSSDTFPTVIRDCKNEGNISVEYIGQGGTTFHYLAGIVAWGQRAAQVSIINCQNTGNMTSKLNGAYIGGIMGWAKQTPVTISECTNTGNLSGTQTVPSKGNPASENKIMIGGMIGLVSAERLADRESAIVIHGCDNSGNITSNTPVSDTVQSRDHKLGGIVGNIMAPEKVTITSCTNSGDVKCMIEPYNKIGGWSASGGIIGQLTAIGAGWDALSGGRQYIANCVNTGDVRGRVSGGILGDIWQFMTPAPDSIIFTLEYCVNEGQVDAWQYAGGIIGNPAQWQGSSGPNDGYHYPNSTTITVKNAKNVGNVTSELIAGGIIGGFCGLTRANTAPVIDSCVNLGTIKTNSTSNGASGIDEGGIISAAGIMGPFQKTLSPIIKNCVSAGTLVHNSETQSGKAIIAVTDDTNGINGNKSEGNSYLETLGACSDALPASQTEINAAVQAIATDKVVLTLVEIALANAAAYEAANYTAQTWAVLEDAIEAAEAIVANPAGKNQAAVDAAADAIETAIGGLVAAPVSYEALKAAIAEAEALNGDDYKRITWSRLTNALEDAKAALNYAIQSKIDEAKNDLLDAIEGLELKSTNNDDNNDDNNDAGNDTQDTPNTDAPATDAPATEAPEKKGCGGAITASAVVISAVLALGAGFAFKKKED